MSSQGTANMSCSTYASRSAGFRVSSTTCSASPTESASSAPCSGRRPSSLLTIGSGTCTPSGCSRFDLREHSMFSDTRATTAVSHARMSSTSLVSARLARSQAS